MKLLHTSDWHLGARLGRHDRQPDHNVALKSLLDHAKREEPDLILHTGDVFDTGRPPYHALQIGVRALLRLSEVAPTVVLAGNHDSPNLFAALHDLAGIAQPRRLWMLYRPEVVSIDGLEDVAIASVPFIPPTAIANFATGDTKKFAGTYADGIRELSMKLLSDAEAKVSKRGIILYGAHLHVHGARPGRSERRVTVGEDYATHVEHLGKAMYAAFGHIHDPQQLPGGTVQGRYAGSLIPLDFGETDQKKIAVSVELGDDVVLTELQLDTGRPLVQFSGSLEQLEKQSTGGHIGNALLKARVVSDEPIPDLAEQLSKWAPDCAIFDVVNVVNRKTIRAINEQAAETEDDRGLDALFQEWREKEAQSNAKNAPDEDVLGLFREALTSADAAVPDLGVASAIGEASAALDAVAAPRGNQ